MADKEALDRNIYLSCVIRIQALLRGALVRKQIEDVKKSYEDLFQELEGNDSEEVDWEAVLCVPKVVKKSSKKETRSVKPSSAGQPNKRSVLEENSSFPVKDNICTRVHTVVNDIDSSKFNSVEVQTSFIDVDSQLPTRQLNESPRQRHKDNHDNHVLVDLDTSWKDRVVPFIQNNFNELVTEDQEYKVNDLHLDLRSDRGSIDRLSSKSENSNRGSFKHSPRDAESRESLKHSLRDVESRESLKHSPRDVEFRESLKHSPREVASSLYASTQGSVTSLNEHRKESFEGVEERNKSKAAKKAELGRGSSGHSSRHHDADVNEDCECGSSDRSEHRSSRSKSGSRYPIESKYNANDEDGIFTEDFEHDRRKEKDLISENSSQPRSAPVSNRSQRSQSSRLEMNNEPDSHVAPSSRSRTSNKSEKSDHSKTHSDKSNSKPTNRSRNTDGLYNHEISDGNSTNRSDQSTERMQHSNRSDRLTKERQRSDRTDRSSERQHSDRSNRSTERKRHSDRTDGFSEHGQKSDRSEYGRISNRSDKSTERDELTEQSAGRSRASSTSSHTSGARKKHESSAKRTVDVLHPPRSSVSPVNFHTTSADDKHQIQDSTTLTNVTSVWDSFNSIQGSHSATVSGSLPEDVTSLKELRKNVSMELLWVQQAIDSRKNYLKLKGKM